MKTEEYFQSAFLKYYSYVVYQAFCILKDNLAAEDVAQEVFLNLYLHKDTVEWEKSDALLGLLRTISIRKAYDFYRSSWTQREINIWEPEESQKKLQSLCKDSAEMEVLRMEVNRKQREILRELRNRNLLNYEILMSVKNDGVKPEIAAKKFGLTRTSVDTRICRTRKWLRCQLEQY